MALSTPRRPSRFAQLLACVVIALAAALGPTSAEAAEPYGTLTLVQERRAGFLEEVERPSRQVFVERDGQRLPAQRGMEIRIGDTLVTERGTCAVTTPQGWRVVVGEGSEVEVQTTWRQRLGTAVYRVRAAFGVEVERVEVLVEGTIFEIRFDGAEGQVLVVEGAVRVRGEGVEALVRAGQRTTFTAEGGVGPVAVMTAAERRAQAASSRRMGAPFGGLGSRADRLRFGLGWGAGLAQERRWASLALGARVRVAGPLWLAVEGGALFRPLSDDDPRLTLAFPTALGLRWLHDLAGTVTTTLGASFDLLLGDRCVEPVECRRVLSADPGGTVDLGLGFMPGKHLAISFEARVGAGLRREYGETFRLDAATIVAPRLEARMWVMVRP